MNRSQLQFFQSLLSEKISNLELQRLDLLSACRMWWQAATPASAEGQEAYRELNYCRNRLREVNKKLKGLREQAVSIKTELSLQRNDPFKVKVVFLDETAQQEAREDSMFID